MNASSWDTHPVNAGIVFVPLQPIIFSHPATLFSMKTFHIILSILCLLFQMIIQLYLFLRDVLL